MRPALLALALLGLGGCSRQHPSNPPLPPGATPPGQWTPPPPTHAQAPAPQPSPWPTNAQGPGTPPATPAPAPPGPQSAPPPAPGNDIAQQCVDTINRYRAQKKLPPLARWVEGEACATSQAAEDARTRKAHGAFGRCDEMAQNTCPNWSGPPGQMLDACLKSMWDEGPGPFAGHGHYNNMTDKRSTKVACGVHTMPDGSFWSVQNFR